MTMRKRMLVAFVTILVLMLGLGFAGWRALRKVQDLSEDAKSINEVHEVAAGIDGTLEEIGTALDGYRVGGGDAVVATVEAGLEDIEAELIELEGELPLDFDVSVDLPSLIAQTRQLSDDIRAFLAAAPVETGTAALFAELANVQHDSHEFYEDSEEWTTQAVGSQAAVVSRLATQLLLVGLGILAVIAAAWVFGARSLARIASMKETAVAIANGHLDHHVGDKRPDEIGELAGAFNSMTQQLRALIANLEARVSERTAELSAANDLLQQEVRERERVEVDLRDAKDFAETVLNSMGDAISIVDVEDYSIAASNRVFQEQAGLTESELIGLPCYGVTHNRSTPCGPPDDVCPLTEARQTGEAVTVEHKHNTVAGPRFVDVSISPIFNSVGQVHQVVHVSRDVTHRKTAALELARYAERLEQSNSALGEFAYVASHDLQEPLRKIQSFGSRLQTKYRDSIDERGQDYLDRMQNAAVRMQALIEGLLTYSRVTSRANEFEPVDLNAVAEGVLSDLEVRIQETGGVVTVGALPTIDADPVQMRQLLQNLIANALKFAAPGRRPEVSLTADPIEASNGQEASWQVSVADNGIGFEQKYSERIFGVFQRLHGRGEYSGTGIGLAACAKIVDRHGGSITAVGRPGEGATFQVRIPSRQIDQQEEELLWAAPAKSAS